MLDLGGHFVQPALRCRERVANGDRDIGPRLLRRRIMAYDQRYLVEVALRSQTKYYNHA